MKKILRFIVAVGIASAVTAGQLSAFETLCFASLMVVAFVVVLRQAHRGPSWITRRFYDMANGGVTITLANGQLGGTITTNDGIMGMVLTGDDETIGIGEDAVSYVGGTPILVTSLDDLEGQGISVTGNAFAYRQVKEYYDEAGSGAQLYLMLVPPTMTLAQMAQNTNADGAVKLLNYAGGKIKVLGLLFNINDEDFVADTDDGGLDATVATALTNIKVLANDFFLRQYPFRAIIGGIGYTGVPADLDDQLEGTVNRAAILIGDTTAPGVDELPVACVGLALGRLSRISVAQMMSAVEDGALPITAVYLGTDAIEDVPNDTDVIAGKGYITLQKFPHFSGYYFSGDDTCSPTTDDYHQIARGRVIDKAHIIAFITYTARKDSKVPTVEGGKPEPGWAKWMEQQIVKQLGLTLVATGDASAVRCLIPLDQDIVSTGKIIIKPRIRPVGYLRDIDVELGFEL